MKIQVLVATMYQSDYSLLKKMKICTDAIVANQCERNSIEEWITNGKTFKYLNFAERGVGLNRNNALMRADADVCLFADDDMVYVEDYDQIVKTAYEELPDADVIIFNLKEKEKTRYIISKVEKVGRLNFLRYGAARISFRLRSVKENGIYFNQCFGGGAEYCHGEDNIFLADCLKKGLKIYAYPAYIASLTNERPSTWDKGYDIKYVNNQGILYRQISRRWWKLLCLQDAIRRSKSYKMSWLKAYYMMVTKRSNY